MTWITLEKNGKIYKYTLVDNTHVFNRGFMDIQIEGWSPEIPMNYDDIICIRTACITLESLPVLPRYLQELEIYYSDLITVPAFPTGIRNIKIIHSKIEIDDIQLTELRKTFPNAFIQIENPYKSIMRGKPREEEQLRLAREEIHAVRYGPRIGEEKNVLESKQTVHISSINDCVCKAVAIIREKSKQCPVVKYPIEALFISGEKQGFCRRIIESFTNMFHERGKLHSKIKIWCNETQVSSLHKLTFMELFQMVMNIAEVHSQKEELKERIRTELTESIPYCFTGRINRLVNALVGFVEGIILSITVRETLQIKIQGLIQRLMNEKIDVKKAKEEMTHMFAEVGDDDGITDGFKQANLLALNDFDEEPKETDPLIIPDNFNFDDNLDIGNDP